MKTILALTFLALTTLPAHAADKVLNGGDACERRFLEVRDDLKSWIERGGHDSLALPSGLTKGQYRAKMLKMIGAAKISCSDEPLLLGRSEKTCLNSLDGTKNARIVCRSDRFLKLGQDEQYRLAHHEYAGLAGFEANESDESRYDLSDQIGGYLDSLTVKRLTVKNNEGSDELLKRNFDDFFGEYTVSGCSSSRNIPVDPMGNPDLCQAKRIGIKMGYSSSNKPSVMMFFLEKDPNMFAFGSVLARSDCQVGYGTSSCSNKFRKDAISNVTTRIEKIGSGHFLDMTIENEGKFEKWSVVLMKVK